MADVNVRIVLPDAIANRVLRAYARATNYPETVPDPSDPNLPPIPNPVTRKQWMAQMWMAEVKGKVKAWEEYEHQQTSTAGQGLDVIAEG